MGAHENNKSNSYISLLHTVDNKVIIYRKINTSPLLKRKLKLYTRMLWKG